MLPPQIGWTRTERVTVIISEIFHGKETVNDMRTAAKFEPVLAVYLNSALKRA